MQVESCLPRRKSEAVSSVHRAGLLRCRLTGKQAGDSRSPGSMEEGLTVAILLALSRGSLSFSHFRWRGQRTTMIQSHVENRNESTHTWRGGLSPQSPRHEAVRLDKLSKSGFKFKSQKPV